MKALSLIFIFFLTFPLYSKEESLEAFSENEMPERAEYSTGAFVSTRVVNGHSIKTLRQGELELRVAHRFDRINKGLYEFFGLDGASAYFGLEYGIFDRLMVGVGRATENKTYNGFLKLSLLRQPGGETILPSLSFFSGIAWKTRKLPENDPANEFHSRLSYSFQLLIARKFTDDFSFQISPTLVHRNLVNAGNDNDLYAIGFGAGYKISKRVVLNAEYFYALNKDESMFKDYYDSFSIGLGFHARRYVLKLNFTNSISMLEPGFIGENTGNWLDGDIHIGFNISRVFSIY